MRSPLCKFLHNFIISQLKVDFSRYWSIAHRPFRPTPMDIPRAVQIRYDTCLGSFVCSMHIYLLAPFSSATIIILSTIVTHTVHAFHYVQTNLMDPNSKEKFFGFPLVMHLQSATLQRPDRPSVPLEPRSR